MDHCSLYAQRGKRADVPDGAAKTQLCALAKSDWAVEQEVEQRLSRRSLIVPWSTDYLLPWRKGDSFPRKKTGVPRALSLQSIAGLGC